MSDDQGVCSNQDRFNSAFEEASDDYYGKPSDGAKLAAGIVYIAFLAWALYLAVKRARSDKAGPEAQLNTMFAFIAPPLYVLAHYVNGSI